MFLRCVLVCLPICGYVHKSTGTRGVMCPGTGATPGSSPGLAYALKPFISWSLIQQVLWYCPNALSQCHLCLLEDFSRTFLSDLLRVPGLVQAGPQGLTPNITLGVTWHGSMLLYEGCSYGPGECIARTPSLPGSVV